MSQAQFEQQGHAQEWHEAHSVTAESVRGLFAYDALSGVVVWRINPSYNVRAGSVAGTKNGKGYRQICVGGKIYLAHRLIWLFVHGAWPNADIDHINGTRDDNRLVNLRDVSRSVNLQNQTIPGNTKTGVIGVTCAAGGYVARIKPSKDAKFKYLGYFKTKEDARNAYLEAKRKFHSAPF